jgi:hypothetical protein
MARFRMTYAFHYGSVKVAAGKTLADSVANSQPGDAVWTGLMSATVPRGAVALDASATTMLSSSPWSGVAAWGAPTGVDSVGA